MTCIFNIFQAICTSLRLAAWVKGVTFDRVVKRIRDLYANGVTSVKAILSKIKQIFGLSVQSDRKRRALGKQHIPTKHNSVISNWRQNSVSYVNWVIIRKIQQRPLVDETEN